MSNNKNICDCYYCEGKYCYRIDARDCEGHIDILITECEEHPDCEHKQLKQLKAENDELKKWKETVVELFERTCRCKYLNEENNHCGFYNRKCIGCLNQCLYKNQQALTEIKEIAEKCRSSLYGYDQERYPKQILQKISEVEDV